MKWTPPAFCIRHQCAKVGFLTFHLNKKQKESNMKSTILSVDLAKDVFEVAIANGLGKVLRRHRLTRKKFQQLSATNEQSLVLMEA